MKQGEVWTLSAGQAYMGRPHPAVILQDERFEAIGSITLCAFTTDATEAPLFRLLVRPTAMNGLQRVSRLMVDKISTVPKTKLASGSAGWMTRTWYASTAPSWSSSAWLDRQGRVMGAMRPLLHR